MTTDEKWIISLKICISEILFSQLSNAHDILDYTCWCLVTHWVNRLPGDRATCCQPMHMQLACHNMKLVTDFGRTGMFPSCCTSHLPLWNEYTVGFYSQKTSNRGCVVFIVVSPNSCWTNLPVTREFRLITTHVMSQLSYTWCFVNIIAMQVNFYLKVTLQKYSDGHHFNRTITIYRD